VSDTSYKLLEAVQKQVGEEPDRIADLAIALYALELGVEVANARAFLYRNLMSRVETNQRHMSKPGTKSAFKLLGKQAQR
jgi:hypothetical protein